MKKAIFLLGDFKSNNGPGNANKRIFEALQLKFETIYSAAEGKMSRLFEMFEGIANTDVLIICSKSNINYWAILYAKIRKRKIIYLMHGLSSYEYKIENPKANTLESKKISIYEKYVWNKVDKIVCVSKKAMEYFVQTEGVCAEKCDYVYNIVETEFLNEKGDEIGYEHRNRRILSVGGGMKQKNIFSIVDAATSFESEIEIAVVGKDFSDGKIIKACKNVTWIDQLSHEDLLQLMRESQLYIQNSIFESFGLSVVEALFAGCSILISNSVGCIDLFTNITENDIIYDVFDKKELVEKIENILKEPNNQRLLKGFDKECITKEWQVDKWEQIINNVSDT